MPIVPIAMALAQLAPSLMKLFGANEPSVEVATKVIGAARAITGAGNPEDALKSLQANAELQAAFNKEMAAQAHEITLLMLKDVQDARARDTAIRTAWKHNVRADLMALLAVIIIVLLVLIVWQSEALDEFVKGVFTLVLGRFLGYLDNIYNFEFGSTRSSKEKDAVISNLTKG